MPRPSLVYEVVIEEIKRRVADGELRPGEQLPSVQRLARELAAFPSPATREHKVWPFVGRIEGAYGDRNLVCVCPPVEAYG